MKKKFEEDISLVENFSDKIAELTKNIDEAREELTEHALKLSRIRKKKAVEVEKLIEEALKFLGIEESKFEIRFLTDQTNSSAHYVKIENKKIKD